MKNLLFSTFILLCLGVTGWGQTTYYSQGSLTPQLVESWNTDRLGGGSPPANFITGDIFVIQNGHSMITNETWSISGTSSRLRIESGGILTATFAITLAAATTFQIDEGGLYVHSNTTAFGSSIFQGTESFLANSTVEFVDWNSGVLSVATFGNLRINPTGQPASAIQFGGNTTTINGNLEILASGTTTVRDTRLSASTAFTLTITGDLIVSGTGSLDIASSAGTSVARTVNIGGNFNQTGGTVKCTGSSNQATINFTGVGKTFTHSAGILTSTNINWGINNGASLILNNDLSVAISRTLTVGDGTSGILDFGNYTVTGLGTITTAAGSTLKTSNISGINGSITVTTKNFNAATNYTFNGSSAQVTGTFLPATVNNLTIDNAADVTLSNSALTVSGTMTINSGKLFTLETGKELTVGTLTNNATAGLVLQSPANSGSPGSIIVDGSISGSGTVKLERYITAYTGASDGWHLLSSPVNNFAIAGSTFEPGSANPNLDDLYWYDEATNFWKNYKMGGNFSTFTNGFGYLCSYQTAATKYFTGSPNNSDITLSNLTLTSTRGWHAIGNPFQSALKWNDGNWTLTNVNTTAKLLNSGGTYSNLVANDIIPAAQGVFVQVTDGTNTITIPKAGRTHNSAIWNKSGKEILARLRFTAESETDNTYAETDFLFDSQASTSVDERNDGFFLQGIEAAPQMFLKIDDQNLSLKRLPSFNGMYNLHFIKGLGLDYSFTMNGIESLPENIMVTLTDTKTNQSQVLTEYPVYTFTSEASDSPDRFLLVFGIVGIGENNPDKILQAYVNGNRIYVMNTLGKASMQMFDLQGRLIQAFQLIGDGLQSQPLNLPAGVYIVRVQNEKAVKSVKIVISE